MATTKPKIVYRTRTVKVKPKRKKWKKPVKVKTVLKHGLATAQRKHPIITGLAELAVVTPVAVGVVDAAQQQISGSSLTSLTGWNMTKIPGERQVRDTTHALFNGLRRRLGW